MRPKAFIGDLRGWSQSFLQHQPIDSGAAGENRNLIILVLYTSTQILYRPGGKVSTKGCDAPGEDDSIGVFPHVVPRPLDIRRCAAG